MHLHRPASPGLRRNPLSTTLRLFTPIASTSDSYEAEELTALLERAERSARVARALSDIAQRLNGSLELDEIFALVVCHATELMDGAGAALVILDGDQVVVVAAHGKAEEFLGLVAPANASFGGECARTGRTLRSDDITGEGSRWQWSAQKMRSSCGAAIAAPLLDGDRSTGAVLV
ncbi:MAG: GAF domain-containing protein, partial [Gemmatimonadota bacterium]|nr:GAF domain-containing protein [Gemmatimonadota bacterium]